MKKALALVLALVMALSLAVSASALDLIELKPAAGAGAKIENIKAIEFDDKGKSVVLAGKGGVFYVQLDEKDYKDITVEATGNVTAELVKYDPEKMSDLGLTYYVVNGKGDKITDEEKALVNTIDETKKHLSDGSFAVEGIWWDATNTQLVRTGTKDTGVKFVADHPREDLRNQKIYEYEWDYELTSYDECAEIAAAINDAKHTTVYKVKTDSNLNLIKLTIADNYGVAYTTGTVTIKATLDKKAVSRKLTVIRDVTIFDYEEVKYCANNDVALEVGVNGYSDYKSSVNGYKTPDLGDPAIDAENAVVVSTTEFRAIEGADLTVNCGKALKVEIEEIAAGQKGVNFTYTAFNGDSENEDDPYALGKINAKNFKFGFKGNQVINSDFTITLDTGLNYFQFREAFGKKVEEDDIVTYYVLKDGKVYDQFTVDYMTVDYNKNVEIEINGKAGDTLGEYKIVITAPSAEENGEENPNTGAESMIGVVAALAVVSVATAAAVSLKK